MTAAALLLAMTMSASTAEISTVDDRVIAGTVTAIDAKEVTIEADGKTEKVPLESVLELRFASDESVVRASEGEIELRLRDGGHLTCTQLVTKARTVVAQSSQAGTLEFPLSAVQAVRFRPADPAIETKWSDLAESAPERDLLVVRNGDVLDRLDGTLSGLDEKTLTFLVGDTRVPIDRTKPKLFGIVIGGIAQKPAMSSVGELRFRNGDRMPVAKLALDGSSLQIARPDGGNAAIDLSAVAAIDFGRDKVRYLSQLEPREKQHVPYLGGEFDTVFDVRFDRSDAGPQTPIRIDGRAYQRGLVIHSRTRLTYRLNGEYRRLVAVAGIEELVRPNGRVTLTISADGKELFKQEVKGTDPPIPLDLNVAGARDLTIFVDFGGDWDDGDHLALGDARLIK